MAVKYAPSKLRVPNGFQNLLEALAREILREQPENIIQFADDYFKKKLKQRAGNSAEDVENIPNKTSIETDLKASKEEEDAAIKIQSVIRGAKARKEVNVLKVSSNLKQTTEENTISTEGAASEADVLPSSHKPPTKEEEEDEAEMLAAATKIQATFRGHKSRKEVDELRKAPGVEIQKDETQIKAEGTSDMKDISSEEPQTSGNSGEATEEPTEEVTEESAAVKIQAHFRGHKARKEVNDLRDASNDGIVTNTEASDSVTDNAEQGS